MAKRANETRAEFLRGLIKNHRDQAAKYRAQAERAKTPRTRELRLHQAKLYNRTAKWYERELKTRREPWDVVEKSGVGTGPGSVSTLAPRRR
jgi:hypothetical protein